jgi:hypothetical protein
MAIGYTIEESLGFYIKYICEVKSTGRKVWDDREAPTMHDDVLEGNGWACRQGFKVDFELWPRSKDYDIMCKD